MKQTLTNLAKNAIRPISSELIGIGIFMGMIWIAFIADTILPLEKLALVPRKLSGLPGIVAMPFLHRDLAHLLNNTFPLFVLLALLAGSRANTLQVVIGIFLLSGGLLWVAGFDAAYVGASMLIFGLIGFLVPAGFLEKRPVPMVISIVVGLMYGWTFLLGLLPMNKEISEFSHFCGALSGLVLAFALARPGWLRREKAAQPAAIADMADNSFSAPVTPSSRR